MYDGFPRLDEAFPICAMQEIYLQVDKNKGLVLSIKVVQRQLERLNS
jgi:hypothetical protein